MHTHTNDLEGGPPKCNPRLFTQSLMKDGLVQHQETVAQLDINQALEQCGAAQSEEACMGKVLQRHLNLHLKCQTGVLNMRYQVWKTS